MRELPFCIIKIFAQGSIGSDWLTISRIKGRQVISASALSTGCWPRNKATVEWGQETGREETFSTKETIYVQQTSRGPNSPSSVAGIRDDGRPANGCVFSDPWTDATGSLARTERSAGAPGSSADNSLFAGWPTIGFRRS